MTGSIERHGRLAGRSRAPVNNEPIIQIDDHDKRPREAAEILNNLTESEDEDIVEAVYEALAMAAGFSDEDDEGEDR